MRTKKRFHKVNKPKDINFFIMRWKDWPNWSKGIIIGMCINIIGSLLFPYLIFFGFFGSWLNFEQYSLMGFAVIISENPLISWIIVLTISALAGLLFDLEHKKNKEKKKRLIIFAILLVVMLVIEVLIFGYSWKNSGTFQTWDTLQDCPGLKLPEAKDSCFFNFAVENNDPSLCYKLSGDYPYSTSTPLCLAKVNRDASYCNNYPNEDERDNCFEGVSIDLLDRSLCNRVINPESKNYCFRAFDEFVSINEIKD